MTRTTATTALAALALLLFPVASRAQDQSNPLHGTVEAGSQTLWGDVYGRPDLPFTPNLETSKLNEYGDLRDGFFVTRVRLTDDDLYGSKYFMDLQSDRAVYRDQSYLGTFGAWNKFKIQFRYDEIPHIYSNTARTVYTDTAPGVWSIPLLTKSALQAISSSTSLPSTIMTQLVPGMNFLNLATYRRAGTVLFSYDFAPDWDLQASYMREHESGNRPMGELFNSSPSASLTGGYGAEIPEPIDYFSNTIKVMAERATQRWGVQLGYLGSIFEENIQSVIFDNPFRTSDCVSPTGCTAATQGPETGRAALYPDNRADYVTFAGSFGLDKTLRLLASVNAGWLHQNDGFIPYTSNSLLEAQTAALPAASLNGQKQTIAMNYTLVQKIGKQFEIRGGYRDFDYINNTPVLSLTPVEGDISAPNLASPTSNTPYAYNKQDVEITGNWYFARKSSLKAGYEGEIMDRTDRDVAHSLENGFIAAVDAQLVKNLSLRASYDYSDRVPDSYVDVNAQTSSGGITNDSIWSRRFDEAQRTRNRGNIDLDYDVTDRLSISGFAGTSQDNYNHAGGVNSPTPLNFVAGNYIPYYSYGVQKDLSYDAGFDGDFTLTNSVSLFADYSWEHYYKSMTSRYRVPGSGAAPPLDCGVSGDACDSANNDWASAAIDHVNIYSVGFDAHMGKKAYLNMYYSLSAGKGNVNSFPLGDSTMTTGVNEFLLTGTNAAVPYPETTNRQHEIVAVFKYKLTPRLTPKIEYRYEQFDSSDYQTSAITPYMGCVSGLPPSAPVPGCTNPLIGTPSPYYPFFVVGDTSAARYLFLGADQPSYRAHYLAASIEYSF